MTISDYSDLPSWSIGPAARAIDGVEAAAPIVRGPLDVGRAIRGGQLLAFDPATAPGLVTYPDEATAAKLLPLLARLADERTETHSVPIDGDAVRLALVVDAAITNDMTAFPPDVPPEAMPSDWRGIDVTFLLEDADGRLHKVAGEQPGLMSGDGQRIEVPLTHLVDDARAAFPGPARLQGVELSFRMPAKPVQMVGIGQVDIRGVESSASQSGDADWRDIGWSPASRGFHWTSVRFGGPNPFDPPPGSPGRILFGFEPPANEPIFGGGGALFRSATTPTDPEHLPAVVGRTFLELSSTAVGNEVAASVAGQRVTLSIIGMTDTFPSLDPTEPFAIVDSTTLERARQATTGQVIATKEWWLSVDPAAASAVEEALLSAPIAATEVVGRASLTRSLASDPVSLGIIGALALGALAAIVFASIGFLVSAVVSSSERITEFAILRALGLSTRELSAWVSLENAFLLTFGLVAGTVLGIVLSWLVLPFATLTETGEAAVPTPDIVVPWAAMAPLYLAALILFVVTVALVSRQVRRAGISTVLRSGDE
jgi:hypothetical protein